MGGTGAAVSAKEWPRFDGTNDLASFLSKMQYLMKDSGLPEDRRAPQLIR